MSEGCVFCRIASGETDTEMIHANETLVVFRDIHPQAPLHLLIVPRKHVRSVNDLTGDDRSMVGDMLLAAKEVAAAQGVADSGYRLFFNVERGGGQVVFHLHMHLIAS